MSSEPFSSIKIERAALVQAFVQFSIARETAGEAAAAAALTQIAETMNQIDDGTLATLAAVNTISHGMLMTLILARLSEVGFALPCYASASDFFQPISDQINEILRRARQHMH